jgi:6-phosphogluconolactonase
MVFPTTRITLCVAPRRSSPRAKGRPARCRSDSHEDRRHDGLAGVGGNGKAGPATTTPSVGGGPFGCDFDSAGHLLVSDAALTTGQSGATSYDVAGDGTVTGDGPAVPISQAAACWLAAAGGYAFTANAGSGSIGRYAVAPNSTLTVLGSTLVENNSASHPLDEGVSAGQHYLYVLANGVSQIVGYQVGGDGSPTQVTTAPVAAGSGGIGAS